MFPNLPLATQTSIPSPFAYITKTHIHSQQIQPIQSINYNYNKRLKEKARERVSEKE